jgi:predicted acylesterase/phospholipase RssA
MARHRPAKQPEHIYNDPTEEPEVVAMNKNILGNPNVQLYLNTLRTKNLAVVLSGGGGKGAYEAGCLLALFDCGIRKFCAFAGTSVGALNAALAYELFRTAERTSVVQLWSTISRQKVLHWNPVQLVAALTLRLGMYASLIPVQLAARVSMLEDRLFGTWLMALQMRYPGLGVFTLLLETMPFYIAAFFCVTGHLPDAQHSFIVAFSMITAASLAVLVGPWIGAHLSLLSNEPLKKTIEDSIDIGALRRSQVPIYCTVASTVESWDPFEVGADPALSESAWRKGGAAGYFRIEWAKSDEEAMGLLIQSAALPEVFPKRPVFGLDSADGGTQDNTPIFPVITHNPDVVIVIYLDYTHTRNENLWANEAARTWWMGEHFFQTNLTHKKAAEIRARYIREHGPITKGQEAPTLIPIRPPLFGPKEFLPITPSKPLGGPFTGMLNFSSKKARKLMTLGYWDTLLKFERETGQSLQVQTTTRAD